MPNERVRGFLQLAATNAVSKICWALTLILLLRHLGQAQFGVLATLWSIAIIAGGFVDLGTTQALVREGARTPGQARPLAAQALRVQTVLTLIVAAVLYVWAHSFVPVADLGGTAERRLVMLLGVSTPLLDRVQNLFTAYSQLSGHYGTFARQRSSYFTLLLAAFVGVVLFRGGILAISVTYFALTAVFALAAGFGTWRGLPAPDALPAAGARDLVRHGIPFLGITVLTLAYGRIEVAVLGALGKTAAAGAYHLIYQLVLVVYSVSGIYFTVLYPRLYRHLRDQAAMRADFREASRWLALLAWAATPPLLLYPAPILHLLGGGVFSAYAPLLRVLALMILLTPFSAALNFLLPMDRMKTRVCCDALGIAITVAGSVAAAMADKPTLVGASAVLGYAATIGAAHLVLSRKLEGLGAAAGSEFAGIGCRAAVAAVLAWLLPVVWWIGAMAYVLCFALLLAITNHFCLEQLRRWHAAIRS